MRDKQYFRRRDLKGLAAAISVFALIVAISAAPARAGQEEAPAADMPVMEAPEATPPDNADIDEDIQAQEAHVEELRARVEEIIETYRVGAQEGDPASMYILAHGLLLTGHPTEGISWMEKAAAQRQPRALAAMGQFHQYGDFGVEQDYELAADLYREAAKLGDPDGMFGLAFLYELGRGVEWDIDKAEALYSRAAELGHGLSQFTLARIHLLGQVNTPDYVTSYKWLKILTEQADTDARLKLEANIYLNKVKAAMQPGQIVEGEAAAKAWLNRSQPPAEKPKKGLVIP